MGGDLHERGEREDVPSLNHLVRQVRFARPICYFLLAKLLCSVCKDLTVVCINATWAFKESSHSGAPSARALSCAENALTIRPNAAVGSGFVVQARIPAKQK